MLFILNNINVMAKDNALSTNDEVKRSEEFQKNLDNDFTIVDVVKDLLVSETEKAFEEQGIEKVSKPAGFYGNGKGYGYGADEGQYSISIEGKTRSSMVKKITYGTKRMSADVNIVYESDIMMLQYKTTEAGTFRGIKEKGAQSFTFHKKFILKTKNINEIKKTLKKIFYEIAQKEVEYLINTRLGVQDKQETGTASSVNENLKNKKMKKLTIKELFSDDDDIISESKKHDKVEPNIDKVKKANTVDLKNGKKNRKMFLDAEKPNQDESTVDEITTTAGGPGSAGPFRYDTPYFAAKQKRPKIDKDYNVIPQKKNESFYTTVDLEPGSGYIPKGMKQNYIQGLHNASPEQLAKWGYADNQFPLKENKKPDLTKKKIFSESENKIQGINKKYLITEKTSDEYKKERWNKLTNFKLYESIKEAEEVVDPDDFDDLPLTPPLGKGGFTPEDEIEYFEKNYMNNDDNEDQNLSEEVIYVEKPNSLFGTKFKFYKKDFMNESKKYILDINTMTFVLNPNSL